jgi:hypothetical protein
MYRRPTNLYLYFAVALAAAVFALDLVMPLGVAAGAPYVVLVVLGFWAPGIRDVIVLAAAAAFLPFWAISSLISPVRKA